MKLVLDIQRASHVLPLPSDEQLTIWVTFALMNAYKSIELTVRIVDCDEMIMLNETYRGKTGVTNVLSFSADIPDEVMLDVPLLGDIVICAEVVAEEAKRQHKPVMDHWAHLIVHGCLHLMGHDHINPQEAIIMEALEKKILKKMGIKNPYQERIVT